MNTVRQPSLVPKRSLEQATVLFCDLRGYSSLIESTTDLPELFDRIHVALNLMANEIENAEGEISDVQGDAVLGFWKEGSSFLTHSVAACYTAKQILDSFLQAEQSSCASMLAGLQPAIGISTGDSLTGAMQVGRLCKNGVFGPATNLGARLQGLTKPLGVSCLLDASTVEAIHEAGACDQLPTRKCGRFSVVGLETAVDVYELIPESTAASLGVDGLARFEAAVDNFTIGLWDEARVEFEFRQNTDSVCAYLLQFMAKHQYRVPADWDGAIELTSK